MLEERDLRAGGKLLPLLDEGHVAVLAGKRQRVAYGVVPQSVDLHLVAVARGYGAAVDLRVHPGEGLCVGPGPDEAVVVEPYAAVDAAAVGFEQLLHHLAVALPDFRGTQLLFELLQRPEEPERGVDLGRSGVGAGEHAVAHLAHERVEHVDAVLLVVLFERDARQGEEGLAADDAVPRIAGQHLGAAARTADDELTRRVAQAADEVNLVGAAGNRGLEHLLDGLRRAHLVERGREDDAFALLELHLEVTGGEQVLVTLIAAGQLLLVLEVVVPVGRGDELRLGLARLQIEPGERAVKAALHAVDGRIGVPVGLHVGLRECVLVAEGEEWTQAQARLRVCVDERVAYHELGALVNPEHLLLENHAAHTIGNRGGRSVLEVGDVLVTARLIDAGVAVQGQVEGLVMLDNGLVKGG